MWLQFLLFFLSRKEAVTSCQEQLDAFQVLVNSLKSWIKETTERVPVVQPSFGAERLGKSLEETKVTHCVYSEFFICLCQ